MVMIRTILQLIAFESKDARTIISLLNNNMTEKIAIENYANVGIIVIEPDGSFSFSSASHYPIQIIRSENNSIESMHMEGVPTRSRYKTPFICRKPDG